jgi:hypothetical protein
MSPTNKILPRVATHGDAQHPKTNPRQHDTQIQRQKQNDSWGEITQLF